MLGGYDLVALLFGAEPPSIELIHAAMPGDDSREARRVTHCGYRRGQCPRGRGAGEVGGEGGGMMNANMILNLDEAVTKE